MKTITTDSLQFTTENFPKTRKMDLRSFSCPLRSQPAPHDTTTPPIAREAIGRRGFYFSARDKPNVNLSSAGELAGLREEREKLLGGARGRVVARRKQRRREGEPERAAGPARVFQSEIEGGRERRKERERAPSSPFEGGFSGRARGRRPRAREGPRRRGDLQARERDKRPAGEGEREGER